MGIKDISLPNGELLCEKSRLKKKTRNLTSWNSLNAQKLQIRLKAGKKIPGKPSALFLRQKLLVLGVKLPKKIGDLAFQVEAKKIFHVLPETSRNITAKNHWKKYALCPKRKWSYSNKPWKKICLFPQKESRLWTSNHQFPRVNLLLVSGSVYFHKFSSSLAIIGRSQVTAPFWRSNKSPRSPPFSFIPPGECDFCRRIQYNRLNAFPWIVYFTYVYHLEKKQMEVYNYIPYMDLMGKICLIKKNSTIDFVWPFSFHIVGTYMDGV